MKDKILYYVKVAGIALFITVIGSIFAATAIGIAFGKDTYESRTPVIQTELDAVEFLRCGKIRDLAQSKLLDEINGALELTNEQRNDLSSKAKWDCNNKKIEGLQ